LISQANFRNGELVGLRHYWHPSADCDGPQAARLHRLDRKEPAGPRSNDQSAANRVARSASARIQRRSPLNWNTCVRQIRRWLSIAFTLCVIANFIAMGLGRSSDWIGYSPLLPFFLLLFTGLSLYADKWRGGRRAGA
jgi:hypothetical protein